MNKNEELLPYYRKAIETLNYNPETGVISKFIKCKGRDVEVGYVKDTGYRDIKIYIGNKNKRLSAHRLAWFFYYGYLSEIEIDHIDRNKDNNRISNLREATKQQQRYNIERQSNNTSGYRGVVWRKDRNKWEARLQINGRLKRFGTFSCPKEASLVIEAKAKELHGEFYAKKS